MVQKLVRYSLYGTTYSALEITDHKIYLLRLENTKDGFEKVSHTEYDALNAISLKQHKHLVLVFNNAHVLSKEIEAAASTNEPDLVASAFPNLVLDDFYYSITPKKEGYIVAIIRKKYVDKTIGELNANKHHTVNFFIGYGLITILPPLLTDQPVIHTTKKTCFFENDAIIKVTECTAPTALSIEHIVFENTETLCLAAIITQFQQEASVLTNSKSKVLTLQNNFTQRRIFKLGLTGMLVFLLVISLVNFLVYQHYFNSLSALTEEFDLHQNSKTQLLELNETVSQKGKLIDGLINTTNSTSSLHLDQLGALTPNTVLLNEIQYHPLQRQLQEKKPIALSANIIRITGESKNPENFNLWINQIESLDFVQHVIINFDTDKRNKTLFELKLQHQ